MNQPEPCCERQSQIEDQLSRLNHKVQRLSELQMSLRDRLSGVLRCEPPCDKGGEKKPEELLVPIAKRIRDTAILAQEVGDGLENMLNCMEL
jgi:hypothetical protein